MYNALINPSLDKILDHFISHGKVGGGAGESREGGGSHAGNITEERKFSPQ